MAPNILAVGGAPGQMVPTGYTVNVDTTASHLAPYAKQGVKPTNTAAGLGYKVIVPILGSARSSLWMRAHHSTWNLDAGAYVYLCNGDPANVANRLLAIGFSAYKWALYSCSGSSNTLLAVGNTALINPQGLYQLDVEIVISDTVGVFNLYLNKGSSPEVSFTGDTLTNGLSSIDRVCLASVPSTDPTWSGIIIADGDTRKLVYKEHSITGAGGLAEMSGVYTTIDETGIDDTDFITASTNGQRDTFTKSVIDSALTGGAYNVVAQAVWMRAQTDPTSLTKGRLLLYDGTNLSESSDKTLTLGCMPYQAIFSTPPDGGSWNFTKAGNTQPGIKALS